MSVTLWNRVRLVKRAKGIHLKQQELCTRTHHWARGHVSTWIIYNCLSQTEGTSTAW